MRLSRGKYASLTPLGVGSVVRIVIACLVCAINQFTFCVSTRSIPPELYSIGMQYKILMPFPPFSF